MSTPASPALRRRRITIIAVALGIAALFAVLTHFGGGARWKEAMDALPAAALLACFAVLPLTGFPVTLLLLAVGARFGFWPGLAATAAATAFHLVASYPLSKVVRRPVTALLEKAGWSLPQLDRGSAWTFSTWLALAPGLSYALKNYTPALAGVPFAIYFLSYYPIHVITSVLGLLIGGATMNFSWPLAFGVLAYGIIMAVLTKMLATRLRENRAASNTFAAHSSTAAPAA
ncbi:hypothetical protein CMV30_01385 [Nibricoccus aquaticus]|uniref:TVP38/TMEM64 family membrane protein n=1 Tax=Nibricoccus aquaticus TaxID=2576891 RepID=A0A290Q248_9BACT|nr:hypothetical protein [Nibricoccus aquaticus]ATC62725.1 hypothetical protein CMV30_01385 [Nibricoccus aquaticus]